MCTITMTETAHALQKGFPAPWLLVSLRPSLPSRLTISPAGAAFDCTYV